MPELGRLDRLARRDLQLELGPLLDRTDRRREAEGLLEVLRAYLAAGRNKSAAAQSLHLSRPAFYDRMKNRPAVKRTVEQEGLTAAV